ncbi:hypothetical protein BJ170DRAFT_146273 [Xylariales sp. AK1849]|nr:hypothetical protein BJ170DRAFT_146273 [Xylariales sp. AK1849]
MVSPIQHVLDTSELLQEIILHLDIRTVLTSAQLVSHRWHALVSESPRIQRHVFLRSDHVSRRDRVRNPLLAQTFPHWFPPPFVKPWPHWGKEQQALRRPVFDEMALATRIDAFMQQKNVSWRRLLISQPPVTQLCVCTTFKKHGVTKMNWKIREFPDGLRMGNYYDIVQQWLFKNSKASVRVFWDTLTLPYTEDGRPLTSDELAAMSAKVGSDDVVLKLDMTKQSKKELSQDDLDFGQRFTFSHLCVVLTGKCSRELLTRLHG